jgi:hypothetical protein
MHEVKITVSYNLNDKSVQCEMLLIYSTAVSLFFNKVPENMDEFFPSWQGFRRFAAVEFHSTCRVFIFLICYML